MLMICVAHSCYFNLSFFFIFLYKYLVYLFCVFRV